MRTARLLTVSQRALDRGVYPSMLWAGGLSAWGCVADTPPVDRQTPVKT